MSTESDCPDDRMVLARRGALDAGQWRALMNHVRGCADCRAMWLAARAFNDEGGTEAEDERLIDRAAMSALATLVPAVTPTLAPPPARPMLRAAVVVGASLIGAVAMANVGMAIQRRIDAKGPDPAAAEGQPVRHARRVATPRVRAPSEPPATAATTPDPQAAPAEAAPPVARPPVLAAPPATVLPILADKRSPAQTRVARRVAVASVVPAASLFARATAARRSGQFADAIAAFRQLEREHPRSGEAVVSLVSLGELLADAGEPESDAALSFVDRYLRLLPNGPLAPEALTCKVRLLARLGRTREAQQSHDELIRRFPDWIYGGHRPEPGAAP